MAKYVWALSKEEMVEHICNIQEQNARAWLAEAISSLPREETTRMIVTLWAIWHAKRKAIYENTFQSPLSKHSFAERYLTDLALSEVGPEGTKRVATSSPRWIPPRHGVAKINVDAALSKSSNLATTAAVARDEAGVFLGASAMVTQGITDPETMEVLAFKEGLALANDLALRRVRMASDCANAVRSVAQDTRGAYSQIIQEIKTDATWFQAMEFVHERRESNHDAHVLVRSSLFSSIGRYIWYFDPPIGVCNSVLTT